MKKLNILFQMFFCYIKNIYAKCFYYLSNRDYSDIWLISERGTEARDNGYAFYKYIKEHKKNISVRYVITQDSPDICKIDKQDIVIYKSLEHFMLYNKAKYLISTHLGGHTPNMLIFPILERHRLIRIKGKIIDLKHGITKDYLPNLNKDRYKLDLLISGAKPEYEYMLNTFNYGASILKYTGFARYDNLFNNCKDNIILIMPTWRTYIEDLQQDFSKTDYFINWKNLLDSNSLNELLVSNNYKVIFYPHYEMQKYIHFFKIDSNSNIIIADMENYDVQDLLRKSKILITDYSSVFFDFAYLEKPIIYYQFDYDEYRKTQYKEGYFDYKLHGFGSVDNNLNEVIIELKKIIKNNSKMEDKYLKRKNMFFTYKDNKNSERIFKEIIKL